MSAAVAVLCAFAAILNGLAGNWHAGLGFLSAALGWGLAALEERA